MLSRYSFFGRRRRNRRETDPRRNYFVDRGENLWQTGLVAILLFVVIDALSTLHIIGQGGAEANPIMAWFLARGTLYFILAKVAPALAGFAVLTVGRHFRPAQPIALVLILVYGVLILYHLYLLTRIHL